MKVKPNLPHIQVVVQSLIRHSKPTHQWPLLCHALLGIGVWHHATACLLHYRWSTDRNVVLQAHHAVVYVFDHAVEMAHGHTVVHIAGLAGGHTVARVAGLVGRHTVVCVACLVGGHNITHVAGPIGGRTVIHVAGLVNGRNVVHVAGLAGGYTVVHVAGLVGGAASAVGNLKCLFKCQ